MREKNQTELHKTVDQSSPHFLCPTQEGCRWLTANLIFNASLCFRDFRHQSQKLSQIMSIFARFLLSQILRGRCPPKVVPA